ncbi:unnamed protein product [Dracunculus medinensis]|uniref:PDGF_2 domain-containing protein n=1 Tax=Dracunculus medinensis TaxID=318479 RepID=A0A0N4UQF0_DRAME|nr:unnamed protein product [Dracunculus medinensis]
MAKTLASTYRKKTGDEKRIKLQGASFISSSSLSLSPSLNDDNTAISTNPQINLDFEILGSIKQGNDTCELRNICIPIPVNNPDPSLLIFPRCYEITQCVGSCCDASERCSPITTEYLRKPIVEMIYNGNNRFIINRTLNITMERHLACNCRDCFQEQYRSSCTKAQVVGPNCNCQCPNQAEKRKCES